MSEILQRELSVKQREQLDNLRRLWSRFTSNMLTVVGTLIILSVVFSAVFAPYIAPYPAHAEGGVGSVDTQDRFAEPSMEHLMGTDDSGRDIFSRVIYGARVSLQMAAITLSISIFVGASLGMTAALSGGLLEIVIMRTADAFMSVPALVLAMVVAAVLEPNIYIAMVAISCYWWTLYCRLVHGEVNAIKEEEFVEAARALGAPWHNIAIREIIPNVTTPILVKSTIDAGFIILVAAGLGFLGLGSQPPTPDWGVMVAQGRDFVLTAWWVAVLPGFAIAYTVYGFNLLGDGLRDIFDVEVDVHD